ncbi:MAG TPA: SDR family NAD(P)-dependent oxidoreductase [Caldilineaceae bacterium]|nr:SDR family NAD(P)-dependent oxidoreductase [Caldilineaceae bacterium]
MKPSQNGRDAKHTNGHPSYYGNGDHNNGEQSHGKQGNRASDRYVLIVGGAGFIGANLAHRLMSQGRRVLVYDPLARPGVEQNLRWLREQHGKRLLVQVADVRDRIVLNEAVRHAEAVYHLGAQVAVTTSLVNPVHDFEVNAWGTLTLLEALRNFAKDTPLLFTSTNKVYGDLADVTLVEEGTRYAPQDRCIRAQGIGESRPLAFHSPYGCSKGAADQYVLDYAHSYGLPATVFRMSCIYGPRQFGTEDQGWVAHFLIRALQDQPITIYGDGKQVRDILFIEDLVHALQLAHTHIERTAGEAFNIGGGPDRAISLLELLAQIEQLQGRPVVRTFAGWRRGDQRYYVSDTGKFAQATGWQPHVSLQEGLSRLYEWLRAVQYWPPVPARVRKAAQSVSPTQAKPASAQQERVYGD